MTPQDAMNIAAKAWERVKPEDDPPFDQCAPDHKFRLAYKVESVAKTGRIEDDFDSEVYAILNPPQGVSPMTPIPDAPSEPASEATTAGVAADVTPAPVMPKQPKAPKAKK
jgi:hypothetical protein